MTSQLIGCAAIYVFHRHRLPKKAQRQDGRKISMTEAMALDAELEL